MEGLVRDLFCAEVGGEAIGRARVSATVPSSEETVVE